MNKEKLIGIYKIQNMISGDFYIGSSVHIKRRLMHHRTLLRSNKHFSIYLQRAWNKYGEENFEFSVLEYGEFEILQLRQLEQKYLDELSPAYNMSKAVDYFCLREKNPLHQANLNKALRNSKVKNSIEYKNGISEKIRNLWGNTEYRENQIKSITSDDALDKRRKSRKDNFLSGSYKNHSRGVRSAEDVLKIRELYKTGKYTHQQLGDMFSVNRKTAGRIISGESWSDI